jgi:hypothetical protein
VVRTTNSGMTSPQISTAAADYLHDFSGLVDFSAPHGRMMRFAVKALPYKLHGN